MIGGMRAIPITVAGAILSSVRAAPQTLWNCTTG
jgi:hypothetical protein